MDTVDREVMIEAMRKNGIREGLVKRTEEMIRETKSRVREGEKIGEEFWTARGVRQGYPLSPLLFSILIGDWEEEMKRIKWEGISIGGRRYIP